MCRRTALDRRLFESLAAREEVIAPVSILVVILGLVGGLTIIRVVDRVGSAPAARLKSTAADAPEIQRHPLELEQRLNETDGRLQELAAEEDRLLDLEERVEFAERLLQELRDPGRLPPGAVKTGRRATRSPPSTRSAPRA